MPEIYHLRLGKVHRAARDSALGCKVNCAARDSVMGQLVIFDVWFRLVSPDGELLFLTAKKSNQKNDAHIDRPAGNLSIIK